MTPTQRQAFSRAQALMRLTARKAGRPAPSPVQQRVAAKDAALILAGVA